MKHPIWHRASFVAGLLLASFTVRSADIADDDSGVALEFEQAAQLALDHQPLLEGLEAQARAARESSVAARQLPDPQLVAGVQDLPVDTSEAGSFTRDSDTQIQIGLMQEFPRTAKRRLRGELVEREATRLNAEQHLAQRTIRRDASLAWLDLWRYDQALHLTRASLREARTQMQVVEIALRTGGATQAEFLGARLEAGRLEDAVSGAEQSIAHARNTLSRWIREAAFRPVCPDLPTFPALPPLETVLARVRLHPHLAGELAQVAAAQTRADLAQADYKPDWRVELGYANRPAFADEVTLKFGIDLPVFTRDRQDRAFAAALAQKDAAESVVEDAGRQLEAEARLNRYDAERLALRLANYDSTLLPEGASRIEAALAGWRSGRGTLREVIEARRAELELQMSLLELQHDQAKHYVQLSYLGAFDTAADTGEHLHE